MQPPKTDLSSLQTLSPDRLLAFSDGVFAIVVTLLVLGIDLPEGFSFSESALHDFFIELKPSLLAYATSFLLISIYWLQHDMIFHFVKNVTRKVLWLNIFFLMFLSLLPFVSKLKALYEHDIEVVVIFASAHIICGLILYFIWRYVAGQPKLLGLDIDEHFKRWANFRLLFIPVVGILTIVISLINVSVGTYLFLLVPLFLLYTTFQSKSKTG